MAPVLRGERPAFVQAVPLSQRFTKQQNPLMASILSTARPKWTSSIILAPGQGAQVIGMGKTWTERSAKAAQIFKSADLILADTFDTSLTDLVNSTADDGSKTLSRTDIAQPAIFVTSLACWAGMQECGVVSDSSIKIAAGLSLGEYTALTLAGAISFEDGLRLVTLRGRAMQDAAEASDGGMVALIGASDEVAAQVVQHCQSDDPNDVLVAANFNAPGQVVLSGSSVAVDRAAAYAADDLGLRVAKLDVAGAFHSPLMQPAADRLQEALDNTEILQPTVPVMSNVTALPHELKTIRSMLVQQLTSPVRWAKCCQYILDNGEFSDSKWIELAPGKTLSGIMRKINRKTKVLNMAEAPVEAEV